MRIRICKKESKETILWLNLIKDSLDNTKEIDKLIKEATELMNIFGAILKKLT